MYVTPATAGSGRTIALTVTRSASIAAATCDSSRAANDPPGVKYHSTSVPFRRFPITSVRYSCRVLSDSSTSTPTVRPVGPSAGSRSTPSGTCHRWPTRSRHVARSDTHGRAAASGVPSYASRTTFTAWQCRSRSTGIRHTS
jgi:hypothetical protein